MVLIVNKIWFFNIECGLLVASSLSGDTGGTEIRRCLFLHFVQDFAQGKL
jgi:hypothetical protein